MENAKVYVDVLVNFDKDGTMSPVDFIWEDGEKYHVDRILARERCASRKAGGTGICYTIMVNGKESHLYYEFDKWFMALGSTKEPVKVPEVLVTLILSI